MIVDTYIYIYIRFFYEHKNPHFGNEWIIHASSQNYEAYDYMNHLDLLIISH